MRYKIFYEHGHGTGTAGHRSDLFIIRDDYHATDTSRPFNQQPDFIVGAYLTGIDYINAMRSGIISDLGMRITVKYNNNFFIFAALRFFKFKEIDKRFGRLCCVLICELCEQRMMNEIVSVDDEE